MYEFNYHKPTSLDEVANLLAANEEAKLVAGGMTLIPTLKLRLAARRDLVDLAAIPSLRGITDAGDAIVIGAMTRHAEVNRSPVVKQGIPGLAAMAGMIGDPRCATAARSAARSPTTTLPPTIRPQWSRSTPPCTPPSARSLPTISSPACSRPRSSRTRSSPRSAFRNRKPLPEISQPGLALRDRRRVCRRTPGGVRVAVTGAGSCVFRVPEMEAALATSFTPDAIKDITIPRTTSTPTSMPAPNTAPTSSTSWPAAP